MLRTRLGRMIWMKLGDDGWMKRQGTPNDRSGNNRPVFPRPATRHPRRLRRLARSACGTWKTPGNRSGKKCPKRWFFPAKTQEKWGKTARGAGGIRTPDGGFAIRCLKPLGHGAEPSYQESIGQNGFGQ